MAVEVPDRLPHVAFFAALQYFSELLSHFRRQGLKLSSHSMTRYDVCIPTLEGFKVLKTWVGTVAENEGRDDHPMLINVDCTGYISMVGKMCNSQHTLWLFNIAMENGPCIDDVPIKTSIYKGFYMAMLNNQRVSVIVSPRIQSNTPNIPPIFMGPNNQWSRYMSTWSSLSFFLNTGLSEDRARRNALVNH